MMDLLSQIDWQATLGTLATLVGGTAGTWFFTELVKKAKSIPINQGDATKIRVVASVLALISTIVGGIASGTLDSVSLQDSAQTVVTTIAIALGAHITYKATK